jgi:hypothetical protein
MGFNHCPALLMLLLLLLQAELQGVGGTAVLHRLWSPGHHRLLPGPSPSHN